MYCACAGKPDDSEMLRRHALCLGMFWFVSSNVSGFSCCIFDENAYMIPPNYCNTNLMADFCQGYFKQRMNDGNNTFAEGCSSTHSSQNGVDRHAVTELLRECL